MRKFSNIMAEFRQRPLSYWFGFSPSSDYELSDGAIIKRVGNTNSKFARVAAITSWRKMGGHRIAVRFADHSVVVVDKTGTLRSILERAIRDREEKAAHV